MSTVVVRKVAATPARTSSESWAVIVALLAPEAGPARTILDKVAGVACSSIASEVPAQDAFVVWGSGPRVRTYCLYDGDAISGEGVNERKLPECPTEGDWKISIPVLEEDHEWSTRAVAPWAERVKVRKAGEAVSDTEDDSAAEANAEELVIDAEEFLR